MGSLRVLMLLEVFVTDSMLVLCGLNVRSHFQFRREQLRNDMRCAGLMNLRHSSVYTELHSPSIKLKHLDVNKLQQASPFSLIINIFVSGMKQIYSGGIHNSMVPYQFKFLKPNFKLSGVFRLGKSWFRTWKVGSMQQFPLCIHITFVCADCKSPPLLKHWRSIVTFIGSFMLFCVVLCFHMLCAVIVLAFQHLLLKALW